MAALCGGDVNALDPLMQRHQNDVFRFCVHYVKSVELAQEITQECFIRIYEARDRFDADRCFRPWMLRIARNLCLNALKRKQTVPVESIEEAPSGVEGLHPETGSAPDGQAMAAERDGLLAELLDRLDAETRDLLVLRFFERLSAKEIADMTDSTEGAVRTRLHRTLKSLRTKWRHLQDAI